MRERVSGAARRALSYASGHLWVAAIGFFVLALAAVLRDDPSAYIADNRFEQFAAPWQRVWNWFFVWDGSRGLGDVREDMWPGTTLPLGLLHGLGLGPAGTVRVWHALCLTAAASGVVAAIRVFRPVIGAAHLLAGFLAAFGPYSATFLVPSNLYSMYALCPWILVVSIRGLTAPSSWRWPAWFALLVFAAGNVDPPGLLYALMPAIVSTLYLVGVERATLVPDALRWWVRAAVLALACSAWAFTKTYLGWSRLDQRLLETELVETAAETSAWPEVFRGLGHWVSYFVSGGEPARPQGVELFTNGLLVGATFAAPVLALLGLWLLRWRPRVLFGAIIALSLVLTVGGFGKPQPPPLGAALLWSLENVTLLSGLRNTYKAAGGVAIGTAVLASATLFARAALPTGWEQLRRAGVVLLGGVAVVGGSYPFWSANLYHPELRSGPVPDYWHDAFATLDDLSVGGRTLIVPATSRSDYRWGHVGDDIFDAHLRRPHAVATGVPLSGRHGADLIEVISRWSVDPIHQPGVLAAMMQRVGITEIVVRNDLDWRSSNVPRPARFDGLRNDPDFERIATFGEPGENVVDENDTSNDSEREGRLPPVEIYRLRNATGLVQSRPVGRHLLVSGDASSWPALIDAGLLGPSDLVQYSNEGEEARTEDPVRVITDSARRRVRTILGYEPTYSHTLAAEQDLGRRLSRSHHSDPDAASVAWFRDATAIDGDVARVGGFRPEGRPAAAFDEDNATAWRLPRFEAGARRTIFVTLREPTALDAITVKALMGANGPTVRRVRIRFSDGEQMSLTLDASGVGSARFDERVTGFVEIFAADIDRTAPEIGISEVSIPGLDLREFIQLPTDALDRGESPSRELPTMYIFRRIGTETNGWRAVPGSPPPDEEHVLRRRFFVDTPTRFEVTGTLRLGDIADDLVEELASAELSTPLRSSGAGWLAIDGVDATGWVAGGASLIVTAPRAITQLEIISRSDDRWSPVTTATVRAGGEDHVVAFRGIGCEGSTCRSRAVLELPEPATRVAISDVQGERTDGRIPTYVITEVIVNADSNSGPAFGRQLNPKCRDLGLVVAGPRGEANVDVSLHGSVGELLHGEPVQFRACRTLPLSRGWQHLDTPPGLMDSMTLASPRIPVSPSGAIVPVDIDREGRGSVVASKPAGGQPAQVIVLANSYSDKWVLSVDGEDSAPAAAFDGLNGWLVQDGARFEFHYRDQRLLSFAIALSLTSVAACLVLIGWMQPARDVAAAGYRTGEIFLGLPPRHQPRHVWIAGVAVSAFAYLVLGPYALLIGAATIVGLMTMPRLTVMVGSAAPLVLALAALATVLEGDGSFGINYAVQRPTANEFGLVAACYLVMSLLVATIDARQQTRSRQRSRRPGLRVRRAGSRGVRDELVPGATRYLSGSDEPSA